MIILHVAPLSLDKITGLTPSVLSYVSFQNKIEDVQAGLLVSKIQKYEKEHDFPLFILANYKNGIEDLPSPYNAPDLVVFHSTYIPYQVKLSNSLKRSRIPYIVVPHGGMTIYAQNKKRFKKLLANKLVFKKYIKNATFIHFLTNREASESVDWGKKNFVLPNGITVNREISREKLDSVATNFLFIGRLDIHNKGLDIMIEACNKAKEIFKLTESKVEIYGPSENKSRQKLEKMIYKNNLTDFISIKNPIKEKEKNEAFLKADVFFHTSRSEGHPMAVLEALSYGLPCLVTPGTNMSVEIEEAQCGWVSSGNIDNLAEKLVDIMKEKNKSSNYYENSISLACNYDWKHIAEKSIEYYKRVLL